MKNKYLEECFWPVKQFTKMVANRHLKGFILYGPGGLGKSYNVQKAFREIKKPFTYLSGHITSLQLYHFLFNNKNKNIVLDDINILDNETNLNMLKGCLNDNLRLVSYDTSSPKLKVPSKFIFTGTICLLLNSIPSKSNSIKAVKTRVVVYELKFSHKEKIKIIFELAKMDYKKISQEKRFEIARWINRNTSQSTNDFNFRVLNKIYEMYLFNSKNWEKLASKILTRNEELDLIINGLKCNDWKEKTGKSTSTYYRYKVLIK